MSAFTKIQTEFTDENRLKNIFEKKYNATCKVFDTPQDMKGWGSMVSKANVIVNRAAFNTIGDLGFLRQKNGSFEMIHTEEDSFCFSKAWKEQLLQNYALQGVVEEMKKKGCVLLSVEKILNSETQELDYQYEFAPAIG